MFRVEEGCFCSVCDKEWVSGQAFEQWRCSVKKCLEVLWRRKGKRGQKSEYDIKEKLE